MRFGSGGCRITRCSSWTWHRRTRRTTPAPDRAGGSHRDGAYSTTPSRNIVTDIPPQLAEALRDRYRLERELGRGGMGAVYLAEDLKHRRKVAVKVLRPDLAAALGTDRFLREIELAAQLQHPAILPLHDSGQAGDSVFYIMPYV